MNSRSNPSDGAGGGDARGGLESWTTMDPPGNRRVCIGPSSCLGREPVWRRATRLRPRSRRWRALREQVARAGPELFEHPLHVCLPPLSSRADGGAGSGSPPPGRGFGPWQARRYMQRCDMADLRLQLVLDVDDPHGPLDEALARGPEPAPARGRVEEAGTNPCGSPERRVGEPERCTLGCDARRGGCGHDASGTGKPMRATGEVLRPRRRRAADANTEQHPEVGRSPSRGRGPATTRGERALVTGSRLCARRSSGGRTHRWGSADRQSADGGAQKPDEPQGRQWDATSP